LVNDSPTAAYAASLHSAGGVKLWVAADDLEVARAVLFAPATFPADSAVEDGGLGDTAVVDDEPITVAPTTGAPPTLANTDAMADRALRAAVLGFIALPPLLHVYSLWLAARALRTPGPLSPVARRRLALAVAFDAVAVASIAGLLIALGG
jgi:hypothetical protein